MSLFYLPAAGWNGSAGSSAYISVQNAAVLSGYNPQYLRRLLRQGRLTGIKVGQLWLIDCSAFDHYLHLNQASADRRCGPQGQPAGEVAA